MIVKKNKSMYIFFHFFLLCTPLLTLTRLHAKSTKIVGLIAARNESPILEQCLKALALYTDAIVYLDDASDDNSIQIVKSLTEECKIQKIISKNSWYRDEPGDRNKLLQAGRELGGTHFIVIDADEIFTANCLQNNFLRNQILNLKAGESMCLVWIQLWRSVNNYRFDNSVWTWSYKPIIFCDDGTCSYSSDFIHTPRIPNLAGHRHSIQGYSHGLLHFQFVNWRNLLIKQAWYRCLEKIRDPQKSSHGINSKYAPSKDEKGLGLKPSPKEWFDNYPFFDPLAFDKPETWREKQILSWFDSYEKKFFADLDIWDVDWGKNETI